MSPAKTLMTLGAVIFLAGIALHFAPRLGLGRLPGDISWRRGNVSVYAPIVTCLVLSVLLTVVFNIVARFFR